MRRLIPLLALVASTVAGCSRAAPPGPACFLIVVDALRADRISSYGYDAGQTPNIDRLAQLGTKFVVARAVASWTLPSMGAMLTSRYPSQLGLVESMPSDGHSMGFRELRDQQAWTLPSGAETLGERMQRVGVRTGAFVNQPALNELGGFIQGFDDWFTVGSRNRIVHIRSSDELSDQTWQDALSNTLEGDRAVSAKFEAWLAEDLSTPIFAWVHLLTPHGPYVSRIPADTAPGLTPSDRYDQEIRAVDEIVGQLLDAIDRHVGLENAHVIFASDHGDAFGEHGPRDRDHGHSLHSAVTRVPLIVASPKMRGGATVDVAVRTIDIMPTMLDLAGIDPGDSGALEGKSLVGLDVDGGSDRDTYAEGMLYGASERSLVSNGFKLLFDAETDHWSLYDIQVDPGERQDISKNRPEQLESMRIAMQEHLERSDASRETLLGESPAADAPEPRLESAERALRALGYIE